MLNVQTPDCVTVNVCPAIVIVPVVVAPVFGATEKATVPLPLPLAPVVTVIQEALLTAVHSQPRLLVIPTLPVPPNCPMLKLFDDKEYEQPAD